MTDLQRLPEPLSERELEILKCLVEGLSNREIASRLHLAYQTVKGYNSEIFGKLDVKNRKDAVERARTLGLLERDPGAKQPAGNHNLPESVTHFVGRKQEIQDLLQLLGVADNRLVTILAPGGMGKTRLSIEVARTQIRRFSDGVYFVPLAPLSSPYDIVTTIAENIGLVFHGNKAPAHQLIDFLSDREMLLVLDNFEHLMEGSELVSDMIQATPDIQFVVTSRERLNLHGETVYRLRGMGFPTWETPDDTLEYDSVKLFLQSAKRVRADFELRTNDLDFLARICRLTAGMPLGIELAAGWVDVLTLEQITNEIQRGIDILATDLRDVPERHRSLHATFEQTWRRLTSEEQTVFARLSVFRGGFTLEPAGAVASANLWQLRKLAQKSLIQIETNDRYSIHELLRQYGESKLDELSDLPAI
jgi:predicted ATPase/DNA-binding CsgD family transcriptional regulator